MNEEQKTTMNDEEKNVMTILTIARIVENSLWYCLPPRNKDGFSVAERTNRGNALKALCAEGSPFAINCDHNGDNGKKLKEDMQYFIEDVYGDPGRFLTVNIQGKIEVESSLTLELFSTIVSLRMRLEAFLNSAKKTLADRKTLEPRFAELIDADIRYYHCFAGKISCILISNKFMELNRNAQNYAQNYSKAHNGINPNQDPEFNVRNDPSFRMLENEFHELNNDMVLVLNNYGDDDEEFRFARQQIYSDCQIFTGKKQTTDINAFFNNFVSYFDKILAVLQPKLNTMFQEAGKELGQPAHQEAVKSEPAKEEK